MIHRNVGQLAGAVGLAIVVLAASLTVAAESSVKLDKQQDRVEVTIGGEPFATYRFGKDLPKPFFQDVRSEGGAIVTRGLEKPEDHPHHKGIWVAIDEVNGVQFWAEKGKIENAAVEILVPEGNPAKMRVVNHWQGTDGQPAVIETTTISIYPNRLLTYDIQFAAGSGPAVFEDTKEGLFGIRVANTLREGRGGGGTAVSAEGVTGSKALWGKPARWIDYYGPVDGKVHGVAIFDHPDNPRASRWHVRDYGLFTLSPFGDKAYTGGKEPAKPLHLKPGETFRLRYGLYVHAGDTGKAQVPQVYESYVKASK